MCRKQILLLGDSIMYGAKGVHGYGFYVKQLLADCADVYMPLDNCQDSRYLYSYIDELIPPDISNLDAVHWNNGLWDVLHFAGNPNPHVSIESYSDYLSKINDKLTVMYPNAKVFFATTTVIPEHMQKTSSYRLNSEITQYNDIACKTLERRINGIDDLYSISLDINDGFRCKDGLHYDERGALILAENVVRFIKEQGVC